MKRHLSISWQVTEIASSYAGAYQQNGWHLDAVRQTRDFIAWDSAVGMTEKDSLGGKEKALISGDSIHGQWKFLFKHADYLGVIAIIMRVWHLAYLKEKHHFKTDSNDFKIHSNPAIAARKDEHDDNRSPDENSGGENYIAALAFDGDAIGRWVNGDFLPDEDDLQNHHENFSQALSKFALGKVRCVVEDPTDPSDPSSPPLGQIIYAGGDDVVCLVPADTALSIARALRVIFRWKTRRTPSSGPKPDASAGIAIAHNHSPLQDLIREAKKAEKLAAALNWHGKDDFTTLNNRRSTLHGEKGFGLGVCGTWQFHSGKIPI